MRDQRQTEKLRKKAHWDIGCVCFCPAGLQKTVELGDQGYTVEGRIQHVVLQGGHGKVTSRAAKCLSVRQPMTLWEQGIMMMPTFWERQMCSTMGWGEPHHFRGQRCGKIRHGTRVCFYRLRSPASCWAKMTELKAFCQRCTWSCFIRTIRSPGSTMECWKHWVLTPVLPALDITGLPWASEGRQGSRKAGEAAVELRGTLGGRVTS